MLKKIAAYVFLIYGLLALWASTSPRVMGYMSELRKGNKWWNSYPWDNGNLVGLSYLDFVGKFNTRPYHPLPSAPVKKVPNTVLYLIGDSYSWPMKASDFESVQEFHLISRYLGGGYSLNNAKKNILVIEVAERMFMDYFSSLHLIKDVYDSSENKTLQLIREQFPYLLPPIQCGLEVGDFFNNHINQNLEFNLFDYNCSIAVFQVKAALNYYLFHRASGGVAISNDGDYLFEKSSVDDRDASSCYQPVSQDMIRKKVDILNKIYYHYKAEGFCEVYLSIIPGTPAIVQPVGYNGLIPKIQNDTGLKMKLIDIYDEFKDLKEDYFSHGDTHWSKTGEKKWLGLVNKIVSEMDSAKINKER
jgi:hypothetical protein